MIQILDLAQNMFCEERKPRCLYTSSLTTPNECFKRHNWKKRPTDAEPQSPLQMLPTLNFLKCRKLIT